eukprot:1195869-Prorocentrum_minimum.AAC.2
MSYCNRPGAVYADGCQTATAARAPESATKKAFDFNSTVDSRRLSTLVYHSARSISNIPPNSRHIFPADGPPHGWPTVDSGACRGALSVESDRSPRKKP